jgi:peptidoglycan/LPS O-acetylase OafA/YrhL
MVGCLLAVVMKRGLLIRFWRLMCSSFIPPLLILAAFVTSIHLGPMFIARYRDFIGFAIDPVLVAILIVQAVSLSSRSYFSWLEWPFMRFLGQISYSLYLWQQLILGSAQHLPAMPEFVQFIVAVTITILAACFSYYVIERPFLRLKDKPFTVRFKGILGAGSSIRSEQS